MSLNYVYLFFAILLEVTGTMLLPASQNFTKAVPTVSLGICYMASFYLLTFAIRTIPVPIVYATWCGVGIFLVAVLSYFLFGQSLSWQGIVGLGMIVVGVTLVNGFKVGHTP